MDNHIHDLCYCHIKHPMLLSSNMSPAAILFLFFKWTVGTTCMVGTTDGLLWLPQVSIVMEQMLRLLHDCGLPKEDVDFINSDGKTMNKLLIEVCIYTKFNNHFLFLILLKRSM